MSEQARSAFLARVRQAVQAGNQLGAPTALPERENLGYQGAGDDPVQTFCRALENAGGKAHLLHQLDQLAPLILFLTQARGLQRVLLGNDGILPRLPLRDQLAQAGLAVAGLPTDDARTAFFEADVGITGVHALIAETGTIVLKTARDQPRSPSLLPKIHLALASVEQILPDLFDLFADESVHRRELPACMSLITGPSKTGDIELRLVTGVHGPAEVHVILLDLHTAEKIAIP